jgi:ribonuclease BN (tRNA processing enzyme)
MRPGLLAVAAAVSLGCAHAGPSRPATVMAAAPSACTRSAPSPSAFELAVLGSGGPVGSGRAASGYVVFIDGIARALVDVGPGAFVRLGEMGIDLRHLDTVLLTHLHIDHSGDLPGFVKSRDLSYDQPLLFRIFGPSGSGDYPSTTTFVERLFGAQGAFAYLRSFRNRLELDAVDLPIAPDAPIHEVLREADVHVTSIAVDHDDAPAVAFRVEHGGHAVVVSGDLASKNDNLAQLAAGADLLVYDASVLDPPGSPPKLYDLHTAPGRIGEVAAKAGVKSLLLTHIPPDVEASADAVLRSVHARYPGPARFASDCLRIDLERPPGAR